MKVALFPNLDKQDSVPVARKISQWMKDRSVEVVATAEIAKLLGKGIDPLPLDLWGKSVDFVVVLGGDGTLLNAVGSLLPAEIPVLGVNLGHLGFLTEVECYDLWKAMEEFIKGEYKVEKRMMLKATIKDGEGKPVTSGQPFGKKDPGLYALNEIVITKGPFARLINLEVKVGPVTVDTYSADGMIVATPTGSTAYSLSAGGPIVDPALEVMILTPICPHTLYWRSLVIPPDEVVEVLIGGSHPDTMLTVDGQRGVRLVSGQHVEIRRAECKAYLMRSKTWNFYEVLRKKLKEGDREGIPGRD